MIKNNLSPKVSIILPTYNRAKFIVETIESICGQTYPDWELLILDDGSDDNTEELITGLKDERIQFHQMERMGIVGKVKNMGLERVSGELIAFIDSDDLWAVTKLEKQVAALQQYPEAGFCITGGYNFRNPEEPIDYFYKQKEGSRYDNFFIDCFQSGVAGYTQALMIRKKCLAVTGNFIEEGLFSDAEFIIRLAHQFKAVILFEPLFYRRLHETNESSSNWEKGYFEGVMLIQSYKNELPSKIAHHALFRLYMNFGDDCLLHKERKKAVINFFKGWKNKPASIIPLKKIGKAILK